MRPHNRDKNPPTKDKGNRNWNRRYQDGKHKPKTKK